MKIKTFGFHLQHCSGYATKDFLKYIESMGSISKTINGFERRLHIHDVGNGIFAGLAITVKNHRKYCSMVKEAKGSLRIKVSTVADGSSIVDFNFFAIRSDSGKGLYEHYHNAMAISGLDSIMRTADKAFREQRLAHELSVSVDSKHDHIRERFRSTSEVTPIYRKYAWEELVKQFESIHTIAFEAETVGIEEDEVAADAIRSQRAVIRFDRNKPGAARKAALYFARKRPKKARIAGFMNGSWIDSPLELSKDVISESIFDEALDTIDVDTSNFETNRRIAEIVDLMTKHRAMLGGDGLRRAR